MSIAFVHKAMPLCTLGHGETDFQHKAKALLHTIRMVTGSAENFRCFRWGIRGVCSDQGTERAICDMPRMDSVDAVESLLAAHAGDARGALSINPEAYFFPLAVLVTRTPKTGPPAVRAR